MGSSGALAVFLRSASCSAQTWVAGSEHPLEIRCSLSALCQRSWERDL